MKKYFLFILFLLNFTIEQKGDAFCLALGIEAKADSFGSENDSSDLWGDGVELPDYVDRDGDGNYDLINMDGIYYPFHETGDVIIIGEDPNKWNDTSGDTTEPIFPDIPDPTNDDQNNSPDDDYPDPFPPDTPDPVTPPSNLSLLNKDIQTLKAKIELIEGKPMTDFPKIIINPGDRDPKGNAYPIDGNKIGVNPGYFYKTEQQRLSILYHEYYHIKHDLPVRKVNNGIFYIVTQEKMQLTEREIQKIIKNCKENSELNPGNTTQVKGKIYNDCIEEAKNELYIYRPSNFYLNEIDAYKAQLQAAIDGIFPVDNEYLEIEIKERILDYTDKYNRAIEYEKNNNYRPDGTKK